ncbi:hypothetical protein Pla52o_15120 [Novipirellula galeiformis]|uniref:Uncharacterized protein n=1 Tax=Novipirellula galeiformis TaxID=2528004 RepID=A0A5C6CP18_9BACT|nr:hypothetical protein Pla52o_15120 [Novipirellula galeiformis]
MAVTNFSLGLVRGIEIIAILVRQHGTHKHMMVNFSKRSVLHSLTPPTRSTPL